MFNEKIKDVINNEEFVAKMEETDAEGLKDLFAEYDVELTDEEVLAFVKEAVEEEKGTVPLKEEDLDNVSGGVAVTVALAMLGWTWAFADSVYGSRSKAVKGIISYWKKKFKRK